MNIKSETAFDLNGQLPQFSTDQNTAMKIYDTKGWEIKSPAKKPHTHVGVMREYEEILFGCASEWAHVELSREQWGTPQTHELVFVGYVDPDGCASQYWAAWPKGWESEITPAAKKPVEKLALKQINEDAAKYAHSFEFTGRKTYRPTITRHIPGTKGSGGGWQDISCLGDETTSPEYRAFLDEKIQEYKASLPARVLEAAEAEAKAAKEADAVKISREAEAAMQAKRAAEKNAALTPGTREYYDAWKRVMGEKFPGHKISYARTPQPGNPYYIVGEISGPKITTDSEKTPL